MGKKDKKVNFNHIVKDKKLPILTLDGRWHELFSEDQKTQEMKELEQQVNNLLKKQGKLVNDIKDMKKLKNSLLNEIMENMNVGYDAVGKAKEKKLDKNKQFVNELNVKIDAAMEELAEIPYQIKEVNEELMTESINCFYTCIESNKVELKEVAVWINDMREELKRKILIKQELETSNSKIYTYMHDILGPELMELFDKEHNTKQQQHKVKGTGYMITGIGVDLVEISRVVRACQKEAFLKRYYTEREIEFLKKDMKKAADNFAVKEAVAKMLGTGFRGFAPIDIEVLRDDFGKPYVNLYGSAKTQAKQQRITEIHVSISNTKDYSNAFVVGERE